MKVSGCRHAGDDQCCAELLVDLRHNRVNVGISGLIQVFLFGFEGACFLVRISVAAASKAAAVILSSLSISVAETLGGHAIELTACGGILLESRLSAPCQERVLGVPKYQMHMGKQLPQSWRTATRSPVDMLVTDKEMLDEALN